MQTMQTMKMKKIRMMLKMKIMRLSTAMWAALPIKELVLLAKAWWMSYRT